MNTPPPPPQPAPAGEPSAQAGPGTSGKPGSSAEPEWIDVSPEPAPRAAPQAAPEVALPPAEDEAAARARWQAMWGRFMWALLLVGAVLLTRWVTWRQSVMYQPPLEVSALSTATPSAGERALALSAGTSAPPAPRATAAPRKILVYVVGLVKKPGVFELQPGARVKDALHLAGGVLPDADLEALNLAEPLEDGRKYRVASRQTRRAASNEPASEEPAASAGRAPQVLARAGERPRTARASKSEPGSTSRPATRRASLKAPPAPLDLNQAGLAELEQLPGVGPATAQRIVDYRAEIGGFKSVDDLDGVKGIGPKKLEKIRPYALIR